MPHKILMPALSPTMKEGKLLQWLVKSGDQVVPGQTIAEIETDKATMEVEAVEEGVVGKIVVPSGAAGVAVNSVIAILLEEGEDISVIDSVDVSAKGTTEPAYGSEKDSTTDDQPEPKAAPKLTITQTVPSSTNINKDTLENAAITAESIQEERQWHGAVKKQTVREALRDAMAEEMRLDERVFLMGEEVAQYEGAYKVSQGLLKEFGSGRVVDTPITEHGFTGFSIGAAFRGLKPIVEFMTWNFAMQAMDQIINSAAKTRYMSGGQMASPIVFRGPNGVASRVGAQHSQCYASLYSHIPGLIVVSPYDSADAKGLLKSAIRNKNPVIFLENELLYGLEFDVPDTKDWTVEIGKAKVCRAGTDVTITAFSLMVGKALEAAEILAQKNISAEVVDLRTLRPLDTRLIVESVKKTNRIVSVEEGWPQSGIGTEIGMVVMEHAFDYLDAPIVRVTAKDVPLPYAENLEKLALPQVEDIVRSALSVCYK